MSYNFVIGTTYSFDVYPSNILGTGFKNVKVLAILDNDSANQILATLPLHISVFPFLPAGTPNDPSQYTWLKILTASGVKTVIGVPWIMDASVVAVTFSDATILVNNVTLEDLPRLQQILLSGGYPNINISIQ